VLIIHFNLVAIYMEIQTFTEHIMQESIQIYAGGTVYYCCLIQFLEAVSRSSAFLRTGLTTWSLLALTCVLVADYYY